MARRREPVAAAQEPAPPSGGPRTGTYPPVGERFGPFVTYLGEGLYELDFGLEPDDASVAEHPACFGRWYSRNRAPFVIVVTLHAITMGTSTQRETLARFEERVREYDRRFCRRCAFVAPSALARGLIASVYWMAPPAYPFKVFSSREPAMTWLRAEGLTAALPAVVAS